MDIYVGNIAYAVTDEDLRAAFGAYGKVESARVVIDRDTGRSRGFGFVEMPSQDEANKAIENLNGTELKGRPMTVNPSRPRDDGRGGGGGGGGGPRRMGGGGGGARW
jgi:RNA recognition motif-containing protein